MISLRVVRWCIPSQKQLPKESRLIRSTPLIRRAASSQNRIPRFLAHSACSRCICGNTGRRAPLTARERRREQPTEVLDILYCIRIERTGPGCSSSSSSRATGSPTHLKLLCARPHPKKVLLNPQSFMLFLPTPSPSSTFDDRI